MPATSQMLRGGTGMPVCTAAVSQHHHRTMWAGMFAHVPCPMTTCGGTGTSAPIGSVFPHGPARSHTCSILVLLPGLPLHTSALLRPVLPAIHLPYPGRTHYSAGVTCPTTTRGQCLHTCVHACYVPEPPHSSLGTPIHIPTISESCHVVAWQSHLCSRFCPMYTTWQPT